MRPIVCTAGALSMLLTTTWASGQTIREATGATAADIQAAVDAFRADLGTLNPNQPGSFGAGRREINWDGVPDADSAPGRFPGDFFNQNTPGLARGAVFSTPGVLFQVSADSNNPSNTPVRFGNLNATYVTAFSAFSEQRLFVALESNVTDVTFFVAGTDAPATVSGFGSVFTDVDVLGSTRIDYFDAEGNLILSRDVLATPGNGSLSFLGVSFPDQRVASVRIISGGAAPGPDDITQNVGGPDIVAMDDFIYGEPIALPAISIGDVAVTEGNTGTTTATFTVTLSTPTQLEVTVDYTTADGTATVQDNDYQPTSGTLTFIPGEDTQTIEVQVVGDSKFEPDETFFVILSDPTNATLERHRGEGAILNDDTAPTISINDVTVSEGDRGAIANFTVSLSNASYQVVTVQFATANGTALAGQDYQSTSGTLTFQPGATSMPVPVLILGDETAENDETFTVNLSNATNATIADGTGTGTITDDDDVPGPAPLCGAGAVPVMALGLCLLLGIRRYRW